VQLPGYSLRALEEFSITNVMIAIYNSSRGASAQRNFAKPFAHGRLSVERVKRTESGARREPVVLSVLRAIE
jgi:hypothetical protein